MQPQNQTQKYDFLFSDIDSGVIKIPKFQRDFVWTKDQTARLIDSIIKGYPIGTFIFWQTQDELRHFKEIGNITLPSTPVGSTVKYVLDGQQRITSLYAVRKGVIFTVQGKEVDYKDICIDLDASVESEEPAVLVEPPEDKRYITVFDLLNNNLTTFISNYNVEEIEKIQIYKQRLTTYDFSTIMIIDYPLDIACDVFTRINTGGTELTLFEIMVAKTYDAEKDFDLSYKYDMLIDSKNNGKDLEDADFDTIPAQTVLQCVSACLQAQVKRRDILKISRDDFINTWPRVVDAIFLAVDWVTSSLRVPVSELMPYNALLVPITYIFHKNNLEPLDSTQSVLLQQYFWWASLTNRFSSGVETKIEQDLHRIDDILDGKEPTYRGEEVKLTLEDLKFRWFSAGDAFCKAILCLYAYHQPKRFNNNDLVKIDNSWLKMVNSKNYHHFFPNAYLKNKGYAYWQSNSILNITIVDDFLNKRKIKARAPKDYLEEFKHENKHFQETMNSHLVNDPDNFGIWDDDYEKFLEERGKVVLSEIESRLNPEL
jgi:hypothetical protein